MTMTRQVTPTTKPPHFATLLVMALDPKEIGERIRKRRKELGWTHQELADAMNVELRTAQRWQEGVDREGKSQLPRLGTLMELAEKMGVDRSYFVEGEAPVTEQDLAARLEALEERVAQGFADVATALERLGELVRRRDVP